MIDGHVKRRFLLLDFGDLPNKIKELITEWTGFGNDCIVPIRSEFDVKA